MPDFYTKFDSVKLKLVLLVLFLSVFSIIAQSNSFKFNHIKSTSEYSINTIQSITQDDEGFIWLGTPNGVFRYDGHNFLDFQHNKNDQNSLSDNFITAIYKDNKGNIWIGTNSGGLNKYDSGENVFERFTFESDVNNTFSNNIRVICEDAEGFIWVGTNGAGLYKLDPVTKDYLNFSHDPNNSNSLSDDIVISMILGEDNKFYIGTERNGLTIYDPKNNSFERLFSDKEISINTLISNNKGSLWIGTNNGLHNYNINSRKIISYYSDYANNNTLSDNYVSSLIIDSENILWVGTHHGLNQFNETEKNFQRILNNPTNPESLSDNIVERLFEDKSGLIWIGTKVGGINTLAKIKRNFKLLRNNPLEHNTISSGSVRSIFVDSSDRLWVGTYGMGLNVVSKDEKRVSHLINRYTDKNSLSSNSITSILEESKTDFWIGTWNGGLNKLTISDKNGTVKVEDVKTFTALSEDPNSISSNVIQILYKDKKGKIWIGTENGLNCLDTRRGVFKKFFTSKTDTNSLSDNRIQSNSILEDKLGNFWIGTWNGLNIAEVDDNCNLYVKKRIFEKNNGIGLSDSRIITLFKDRHDNIWAGTYGGGLNKITYIDGVLKVEYFTTADGLPSNIIYGIKDDEKGNLWLSTHHGLSKFNPRRNIFTNYDETDGLQNNQFFWGASFKDKNGILYFGGIEGLNYFNPDEITTNKFVPPIVITKFGVIGKNKNLINFKDKSIELEYDENMFSIEFAALDFSAPNKNRFSYILEGFDKEWINLSDRRYVSYTNLDGGDYIFKVKGSNNHNIWNKKGTELHIKISPPLWATWYAYLFYILVVSSLIIGFIQLKTKKQRVELTLKNKALEDEKLVIETLKKVDKLKSEFLAQMSHEIRTPINTILSFTSLLKAQYEDEVDEDTKTCFKVIGSAGERIIRTIDLILNMAEIQTGTYEYLPKKMDLCEQVLDNLYLEFSILAKEKGLNFEMIKETGETQLFSDKYIVGQILNNLIHNAVKYTLEGKIVIKVLRNAEGKLIIEIIDSGIGISEEHLKNIFNAFTQEQQGYSRQFEGNGLGLALVKEYCKIISAKIEVESIKGKGSTFRVIFPAYSTL